MCVCVYVCVYVSVAYVSNLSLCQGPSIPQAYSLSTDTYIALATQPAW